MNASFVQRMPDDLNERLARLAEMQGISKNELINTACEKFLKTGNFADLEWRITELEKEVFKKKTKKKGTRPTLCKRNLVPKFNL
jgi:predicted DNA-binding protein